jgi:hypothetical protein
MFSPSPTPSPPLPKNLFGGQAPGERVIIGYFLSHVGMGKRIKGIGFFNVLKNNFHLLIHIDRRPLYDRRDRSFVGVFPRSILQGEKDISPFPDDRFPRHF